MDISGAFNTAKAFAKNNKSEIKKAGKATGTLGGTIEKLGNKNNSDKDRSSRKKQISEEYGITDNS